MADAESTGRSPPLWPRSDAGLPPLVGPLATTGEWQSFPGRVLVLPVGATEQHGPHLPVGLDFLNVQRIAAEIARRLDAALLPVLPFGQSYEHSAFRGSFSLRPETMLGILRDLADEAERQGFTRLVLVNGHGGNHVLGTVVRDLNRRDRPLRTLLFHFWEYGRVPSHLPAGADIHAGFEETCITLALMPDVVRTDAIRRPETEPVLDGAVQRDLDLIGLQLARPTGVWGDPSGATAEHGAKILDSMLEHILAAIRQRLAWCDAAPRYVEHAPLQVRPLVAADIPAGMALCAASGWNQTAGDWRVFLDAAPGRSFAAVELGRVVGTAATIDYGPAVSWVSMVLVDPLRRRLGIGTLLLNAALAALAGRDSVKLDATPEGRQVYLGLGFQDEYPLARMEAGRWTVADRAGPPCRPMAEADLPGVVELDARAFGAPRPALIRHLFAAAPRSPWTVGAGCGASRWGGSAPGSTTSVRCAAPTPPRRPPCCDTCRPPAGIGRPSSTFRSGITNGWRSSPPPAFGSSGPSCGCIGGKTRARAIRGSPSPSRDQSSVEPFAAPGAGSGSRQSGRCVADEAVARAADGQEMDRLRGVLLERLPEREHERVDGAGGGGPRQPPHVPQQLVPRDDAALVLDEVAEQLHFQVREPDRPAVEACLPGVEVDFGGTEADPLATGGHDRPLGPAAPGEQIADHGQQFVEFERLLQVDVGARIEAADAVLDQRPGREHHHRQVAPPPADGGAHVIAAHPGQHDVEHDQVDRRTGGIHDGESRLAVAHRRDGVALRLEVELDPVGEVLLVLDYEDVGHGVTAPGRCGPARAARSRAR
jgi:creatinine amidohydrolase/Fe(II)-dependent formamide hydrolase-like protein/GNAT superfamily N-acetyltransferase